MDKKQQIIAALYAFVNQRGGLEFANYGDVKAYRQEQRAITKDGHQARRLIRDVELRDSISADDIIAASKSAYSGRLSIVERDDGAIAVDYCTGQYFPTEYRRAVCAVMSAALWAWKRDKCMPAPIGESVKAYPIKIGDRTLHVSGGEWLRSSFRREYGRSIASRWFD